MNDFPASRDDEIVSAVVDDEATADERARVEADPALRERAAEFRRLHDAVATPVAPLDEFTSRRLLDRALDAAEPLAHTASGGGASGTSWWRRGVGVSSAAAILLLAILAGPAVLRSLEASDDDAASGDGSVTSTEAFLSRETDGLAGDDAFSYSTAPTDATWLGSFDEPQMLAEAMRERVVERVEARAERSAEPPNALAMTDADSSPVRPYIGGCPGSLLDEAIGDTGRLIALGEGWVNREHVMAAAVIGDDGILSIVGIDLGTCSLVELD